MRALSAALNVEVVDRTAYRDAHREVSGGCGRPKRVPRSARAVIQLHVRVCSRVEIGYVGEKRHLISDGELLALDDGDTSVAEVSRPRRDGFGGQAPVSCRRDVDGLELCQGVWGDCDGKATTGQVGGVRQGAEDLEGTIAGEAAREFGVDALRLVDDERDSSSPDDLYGVLRDPQELVCLTAHCWICEARTQRVSRQQVDDRVFSGEALAGGGVAKQMEGEIETAPERRCVCKSVGHEGGNDCDCVGVFEEFMEEVVVPLDCAVRNVKRAEEEWEESLRMVQCACCGICAEAARRIPLSPCFLLQEC